MEPTPEQVEAGVRVLRAMLGDMLGTDQEVAQMAYGVLRGGLNAEPLTSTPEPSTTETEREAPINHTCSPDGECFCLYATPISQDPPPGFSWEYRAVCDDGNRRAGLRSSWNVDADLPHDYARRFFGPREWWIERRLVGPAERI